MATVPDAPPVVPPARPRSRWFWGAVVAALGLWLILLLWMSHEPGTPQRAKVAPTPPGFDPRAATALSRRRELTLQKPSGAVPPRVDRAESK